MNLLLHNLNQILRKKLFLVPFIALTIGVFISLLSYTYVGSFSKYIVSENTLADTVRVGVVLGGGIEGDQPRPLLRDRLETAKRLLETGVVDKLVLSGDNRFESYNEPAAMQNYLVAEGVDIASLQLDFAGRSSYETCERAKKIFGLDSAVFVSESTHLPRVLYLCRHFGIEAYGVASDGAASSGSRIGQRWREVLARNKALLNVYIKGENTVLGEPIRLY